MKKLLNQLNIQNPSITNTPQPISLKILNLSIKGLPGRTDLPIPKLDRILKQLIINQTLNIFFPHLGPQLLVKIKCQNCLITIGFLKRLLNSQNIVLIQKLENLLGGKHYDLELGQTSDTVKSLKTSK